MSKEERYAEHTVAWELPNGDSVTKSNYNLADIETKYMPIQTEVICDDKDKTIVDLEAKLAESENRVKDLKFRNKNLEHSLSVAPNANAGQRARIDELTKENKQLKQQLAEKEKENELMVKTLRMTKFIEKEVTQDKISFCIERLEKVKEFFLEEHRDDEMDTDYIITKDAGEIADYLLDQIKQLKEMK